MRRVVIVAGFVLLAASLTACDPPSGTIAGTLINNGVTSRVIQYNVQGTNTSLTTSTETPTTPS